MILSGRAGFLVADIRPFEGSDSMPAVRPVKGIRPYHWAPIGDQPDQGMMAEQRGLGGGQQTGAETLALPVGSDEQSEDLAIRQIDQAEAHHLASHLHYPGTGLGGEQLGDLFRGDAQFSELLPGKGVVRDRGTDGEQRLYVGQGGKPQLSGGSASGHRDSPDVGIERCR